MRAYDEALTVRSPGSCGDWIVEVVDSTDAGSCAGLIDGEFSCLGASEDISIVGTPGNVADAALVVRLLLIQTADGRPCCGVIDDDGVIFGSGCQHGAVVGEFEMPDFISMVLQLVEDVKRKVVTVADVVV